MTRARRPPLGKLLVAGCSVLSLAAIVFAGWSRLDARSNDPSVVVERGTFRLAITAAGVLQPAASITYRSPLAGRETEITFLAPEGIRVAEGDLLVRLDSSQLESELGRTLQARAQAAIETQLADVDLKQAKAGLTTVTEGEGALGLEESAINLRLAERRAERLQKEHESLKPLLERGYITSDELERTGLQLDEALGNLQLARRKSEVLVGRSHPREQMRAKLEIAQREAQYGAAQQRISAFESQVSALREAIAACSVYARGPGLVVHEEYLAASPSRKIRVGDRVTATQGIVTIPDVERMQVRSSVREAEVSSIRAGQPAIISVEAFPGRRLTGRVATLGSVARATLERPSEDKRFDVVADIDTVDLPLRPEMTARLDVIVEETENAVLVPLTAIFDADGTSVQVVGRWGRVDSRPIRIKHSNNTHASVEGNLQPGERVRIANVAE